MPSSGPLRIVPATSFGASTIAANTGRTACSWPSGGVIISMSSGRTRKFSTSRINPWRGTLGFKKKPAIFGKSGKRPGGSANYVCLRSAAVGEIIVASVARVFVHYLQPPRFPVPKLMTISQFMDRYGVRARPRIASATVTRFPSFTSAEPSAFPSMLPTTGISRSSAFPATASLPRQIATGGGWPAGRSPFFSAPVMRVWMGL